MILSFKSFTEVNFVFANSWVHICCIKKRTNCLYVYFLNATLLMFSVAYINFFTSNERASDCESYDIKKK